MGNSEAAALKQLVARIRSSGQAPGEGDLVAAAAVFEKYRGVGADLSPQEQAARFAWPPEIASSTLHDADVRELRSAMIERVRRSPTGMAVWALGKCLDAELRPLFIEAMESFVDHNPAALYQAMIALQDLGEDPFAGRGELAVTDVDQNVRDARNYLARVRR